MRPLSFWDCGFESRRRHGFPSLVSVVCCQVEGLCDGLITRPEGSYLLWCVAVCVNQELSRMRWSWLALGRTATGKEILCLFLYCISPWLCVHYGVHKSLSCPFPEPHGFIPRPKSLRFSFSVPHTHFTSLHSVALQSL
jgi:hypothetical protein